MASSKPGSTASSVGNPSALADWSACVRIRPADRFTLLAGASDGLDFPSVLEASRAFRAGACEDGLRLLRAARLAHRVAIGLHEHAGHARELLAAGAAIELEAHRAEGLPRAVEVQRVAHHAVADDQVAGRLVGVAAPRRRTD